MRRPSSERGRGDGEPPLAGRRPARSPADPSSARQPGRSPARAVRPPRCAVAAAGASACAELRHRGEPVRRHRRQRPPDRLVHAVRHVGPHRPRARRRLGEPPDQHRLHGGAGERRLAGQHLVQHGGERVDVGARVERLVARRLLGAHVGRRPDHEPGVGQLLVARALQRPSDAEVGDQRVAVPREQQVLGLDVPVDHAVLVGVLQRLRRLARDPERVLHRELPLAPEPVAQALALDERHGEPELPGRPRRSRGPCRMWGCCSRAASRISRWKRSGPSEADSSGWSTLSATGRSCFRSWARKTVAMPPRPSSRSSA